jgi:hypothetical protein
MHALAISFQLLYGDACMDCSMTLEQNLLWTFMAVLINWTGPQQGRSGVEIDGQAILLSPAPYY